MTDSPVADRFVAAPDNWSRNGAGIRAICIHLAEGGGTVSWLTRNDGNSSHYVVQYDGTCTQMVLEARAAGSMNPRVTRTDNDATFNYLGESVRYGITALKAALGSGYTDPNRYVVAIEVEGFAATGPNAKQRATLARLVADIRRRHGALPVIGHRDQQRLKACPGHKVPWVDYGGHGVKVRTIPATIPVPVHEDIMQSFTVPEVRTAVTLKEDPARPGNSAWIYTTSACVKDGHEVSLAPVRPLILIGFASADVYIVAYEPSSPDANTTSVGMFVKVTDIAKTSPITDQTPYTQAQLDAAKAAGEKVGITKGRAQLKAEVAALP